MLIKPSGVPYDDLRPERLVVVGDSTTGGSSRATCGRRRTRRLTWRCTGRYPEIGGIVHTHSTAATSWAQARRPIPPFGTTHADHFHGAVPVTRRLSDEEVAGDYEAATGAGHRRGARRRPASMPSRCRPSWSPRTGRSPGVRIARAAADNAIALEAVAAMAIETLTLDPDAQPMATTCSTATTAASTARTAYYGQRR